ncbi:long-chain fatty acid--CoA ligase [Flavobacterium agricola]|uniref:Long-chain fatty acid--CoA ligase n=1 Tax=Flavobacterium agricola TaxID=2870839 RepID=A0ABY6M2V8_9FLAO|nr:long-chain fatty acid--CoA ligase [Flavobacterium agricola]UYW01663.1 long-chain fatty acid--CoA ligase [Flavobacterium agricola]
MNKPSRLFDLPLYQSQTYPDLKIFNFKKDGVWQGYTALEFLDKVNAVSRGLLALGVKPNDKVGLISENRVEWNMLDFAIQQIGAVVVAVYPNISVSDYLFIFDDAEIKTCFVSNENLYDKIKTLQNDLPLLKNIYTIDVYPGIPCLNEVIHLGANTDQTQVDALKAAVDVNNLATLAYTSGTTGNPKGVMLSHKNIMADMYSSEYSFPVESYDRALTFLPVCHAYERLFHYVYIYKGVSIWFAQSMETIGEDMKEVKPHIFSAVPRVLEKVYEKIMAKGHELTGIKRKLFFWAIALGKKYDFDNRSPWYNFQLAIARKLIFSKWREAIGGEIKAISSGSAAIQQKLIRIYTAAGINIYEGYGLTEAAPCIAVNCFKRGMKLGTVGVPLINIDVKIADDGEILVKGDNVMQGYYKNQKATDEVLIDGWLHTGDIGTFVDGKYLKITDRKKEIFKTSGGKYIVPQYIESKLVESPLIEQIMVVGEGEKFPGAFVVPNYPNLLEWAKAEAPNLAILSKEAFLTDALVFAKLQDEITTYNVHFGNWEQIKKFAVIPNEFTIEGGELTPTLKFKRKFITAKYKEFYDKIFK